MRLGNLLNITQLESGRTKIWAQACLSRKLTLYPLSPGSQRPAARLAELGGTFVLGGEGAWNPTVLCYFSWWGPEGLLFICTSELSCLSQQPAATRGHWAMEIWLVPTGMWRKYNIHIECHRLSVKKQRMDNISFLMWTKGGLYNKSDKSNQVTSQSNLIINCWLGRSW